jgi:ArsR family transcriptional regulator
MVKCIYQDELIAGCVGGALLKEEYLKIIQNAGFSYNILDEDKEISKRQYQGFNLESLKVELYK